MPVHIKCLFFNEAIYKNAFVLQNTKAHLTLPHGTLVLFENHCSIGTCAHSPALCSPISRGHQDWQVCHWHPFSSQIRVGSQLARERHERVWRCRGERYAAYVYSIALGQRWSGEAYLLRVTKTSSR